MDTVTSREIHRAAGMRQLHHSHKCQFLQNKFDPKPKIQRVTTMKTNLNQPAVFKCAARALAALMESPNCRQETAYSSPNMRATVTRQFRPSLRDTRGTVILTFGKPNYEQAKFVRACIKAKEPFPIWKVQLKFWPAKKRKK